MRIRFTKPANKTAITADGSVRIDYKPGDVVEMPDDTARAYLGNGVAEIAPPEAERATKPKASRAVKK